MNKPHELIPPPPIVRERLAHNIKERRLLRALLRLSIRTVEEFRETQRTPRNAEGDKAVDR